MNTAPSWLRRFRFNLRILLYVVAVFALLLTLGPQLYQWFYSIPLAHSVMEFNARYADHPVGKFEPPLTETEIVDQISARLPNLSASSAVKSVYSSIARTRRIPRDASLDICPGLQQADGTSYTVWWIDLNIMTGRNTAYTFRIRENNEPVAKPKGEPELVLSR
jgi:hypothetical protein